MSNPAYHIRTYFSCSRKIRDELNRMAKETGISKSGLVRIAGGGNVKGKRVVGDGIIWTFLDDEDMIDVNRWIIRAPAFTAYSKNLFISKYNCKRSLITFAERMGVDLYTVREVYEDD